MKLFLFIFLCMAAPAAAETGYFSMIDDLPLMANMTELANEAIIFDKPNGRIVEVDADVPAQPPEIQTFYAAALPPLGWKALTPTLYAREGEVLNITIRRTGSITRVRFTLTPEER